MEAYYQRQPDGRIVCRFSNGQEDQAREFLARGPVSPPIRRPAWPGVLAQAGLIFGMFLVAAPVTMWIANDYSWTMVRIGLGLAASFGGFVLVLGAFIGVGTVVEPEREFIKHRATHSFASLGLPQRTRYTTPASNGGLHGISFSARTHEVVSLPTSDESPVVFGSGGSLLVDQLAEEVNETLFEYQERAAVRDWLDARERELGESKSPYRRG